MCDYSLDLVASRPARVGDKLISTSFPHTTTRGFASVDEPNVAVCLLPGTEPGLRKEIRCETCHAPLLEAGAQGGEVSTGRQGSVKRPSRRPWFPRRKNRTANAFVQRSARDRVAIASARGRHRNRRATAKFNCRGRIGRPGRLARVNFAWQRLASPFAGRLSCGPACGGKPCTRVNCRITDHRSSEGRRSDLQTARPNKSLKRQLNFAPSLCGTSTVKILPLTPSYLEARARTEKPREKMRDISAAFGHQRYQIRLFGRQARPPQ